MSQKYKNLMSPLKVRNFVLKNRMAAANSLPHFLQGPETYPADSVMAHYENKAKGAAITTCMGINNFTIGKQFPMDMDFGHFPDYDLYDCNSQNYLMQLADSIHYYDSVACMAMFVGPPSFYPLMKKKKPEVKPEFDYEAATIGPPPMEEFEIEKIFAHGMPEDYDEETLDKICDSYAEQACILQTLGYDMVSIHYCYRGNLPSKFMSPHTNKRTDKYGGSLENRMRFPLAVLERVRNKVGKNFLIEIEWSAEDLPGGYTLDDTVIFLNEAKKYIDIVQLRASKVDPAHPTGFNLEETPFLHYSEYVKKRVDGLVIGTIGGYHYIDSCEKAIAEGKADLIYMARAWISNSNYFDLVKEGRGEDLVPCLRCNKCHGRGEKDPFVSVCSVNPVIGLEHKIDRMIAPVTKKKKVAIVGGGPGGMRCAMYLEERGHEVTIYEAGEKLGGAIKHSDYASFKWPLRDFKNFLIAQVEKHNITVRMNTKATPDMLSKENYDVIITALGAVPAKPPIPGIDNENVFFAEKAFMDQGSFGKNVVVIGGGEVGIEVAMHLCEKGHNATVLEMRDRLAADSTKIHYLEMFKEAWEALPNFGSIVNVIVTGVKDNEVCYKDKDGTEHSIPCDSVVVSAGVRALTDEALKFAGIADEFYMIGDCKAPATIQQAMRSAFSTAMRI
jgi:2,4-dienoyl-CoA reductase-like NADH-dependent reductase (Old Yellow Enzyme family)/thioredoxin reductase